MNPMNSRAKGARGERQWRDELRANGYDARRGQQFSGSPDSPDVVCPALPWIHFEVKAVERLNIEEAMEQARRDSVSAMRPECHELATKVPIVAHRRRFRRWLVTMEAETFFRFLRGDFYHESRTSASQCERHEGASTEGNGENGEEDLGRQLAASLSTEDKNKNKERQEQYDPTVKS